MSVPIYWDDDPVPTSPEIEVFSVPAGAAAFVRLLGAARGVRLHWAGRSRPCSGTDECRYCLSDNPAIADTRRVWYAPGQVWSLNKDGPGKHGWCLRVVQISLDAWRVLKDRELRGLICEFKRAKGRANNPVQVRLVDRPGKDEPPPAFDVTPILLNLWGLARVEAGQANPSELRPVVLPMRPRRKAGGS